MSRERVLERYKICLYCKTRGLSKEDIKWGKQALTIDKINRMLESGYTEKWYNPVDGSVEICTSCSNAGKHYRLREKKSYVIVN